MVTQPGSRSAATTLPRSSGSATPTESSPAGGCPQLTAQQCTQTPQSGVERPDPPICVHSCDPKATHSPSPQFNSVHKRPKPARRGPILPSVYTIAATRGRPRHNSVHKRPKSAWRGPILSSVYTLVVLRVPTVQQWAQTPQFGVRRLLPPICVHYRGHAGPPATQRCTQTPKTGAERPLPPICVHYRGHAGPPTAQQCTQMHPRYSRRVIASSVRRLTSAAPRRTPRSCRTGWRPSRPRRRGRCAPRPERSPAPCSGCGRFPSSCWQTRPR